MHAGKETVLSLANKDPSIRNKFEKHLSLEFVLQNIASSDNSLRASQYMFTCRQKDLSNWVLSNVFITHKRVSVIHEYVHCPKESFKGPLTLPSNISWEIHLLEASRI